MNPQHLNRMLVLPLFVWAALAVAGSPSEAAREAASSPSRGAEVEWLLQAPTGIVAEMNSITGDEIQGDVWTAAIGPSDPYVVLKPVQIDATRNKILYLQAAFESTPSLQIFFWGEGAGVNEEQSVRVRGLAGNDKQATYAIDMRAVSAWKGSIRGLRLDPDQAVPGSKIQLCKLGTGNSVAPGSVRRVAVNESGSGSPVTARRSAAFQDTTVSTLQGTALSAVMTFIKEHHSSQSLYVPAKLQARAREGSAMAPLSDAKEIKVEDFPGGVRTECRLGGSRIVAELIPLMVGRDTEVQDGAALYVIESNPPVPLEVDCGGGSVEDVAISQFPISDPSMDTCADSASLADGAVLIKSPAHPFRVAVKCDGETTIESNATGGQFARCRSENGRLTVLVAFGPDEQRARQIALTNAGQARKDVSAYYENLLKCKVNTPSQNINDAFRAALYNLEYAWYAPYGWTESINFWHALWHMQHTAGEEWIGHADRSRLCNLTHGDNLMPDGAVPHMMQYLSKRRDFGGTNQFFCWQVRHYWQFTGDKDFAARIAPVLDRVIAQTYAENDPDGDMLLGWGLQIGNQEDYIATPHNGTTPSIEGINMYRTRREIALALGDRKTAERCDSRIEQIESALRKELWLPDLGRFAFYRDPLGPARLDGQYHSLLYPVIFDIANPLDAYTTLRQARDRLTGDKGNIYCSNNFPTHFGATAGMQTGMAQQPWAAWALSKAGMRNEAWRPLAAAAQWVVDRQGAFPEVALEPGASYFSPPAGLFVASTVETLFGLKVNKPEGRLSVAPCFPDEWPKASLDLPDYQAEFARSGNTMEYRVRSKAPAARHLRWSLPPSRILKVQVDGKPAKYRLEPGVGCVFLVVDTPSSSDTKFTVSSEPIALRVHAPASIAEGDAIDVGVDGLSIVAVEDPCGALARSEIAADGHLRGQIRAGLLDAYRGYGRLGQMTLSRRTFFLQCKDPKGTAVWLPVDLAILPRYETAAEDLRAVGDLIVTKLQIRNNTSAELKGQASLRAAQSDFPLQVNVAPRSEQSVLVSIPKERGAFLSPGNNAAVLTLPGPAAAEVVLNGTALFQSQPDLQHMQDARLRPIELPGAQLIADDQWHTLRSNKAYPHMPWAGLQPPLECLGEKGELAVPELAGLAFHFAPRRFIPISFPSGRPSFNLPLEGAAYKKLYLLVVPFLDNHDMFSPVAQVAVEQTDGGTRARTLYFPGDLDWWSPEQLVSVLATARGPRPHPFGLLPQLSAEQGDWPQAHPPEFPQTEFWASCLAVKLDTATLSVIEIDLGSPKALKSLSLSAVGAQPAFGLVGVVGETGAEPEKPSDKPKSAPAKRGKRAQPGAQSSKPAQAAQEQ